MALSERLQSSTGGPSGGATWADTGESVPFAQITNNSTTFTDAIVTVVSTVDQLAAGGVPTGDYLPVISGLQVQPIQRLTGGQLVMATLMASSNLQSFGLAVRRTCGFLNAQITNAGGAITTLPFTTNTSLPAGAIINLTNVSGNTQAWTVSSAVSVPFGSVVTSIPVNSATPGNTYPATTSLGNVIVGAGTAEASGLAFGWIGTGAGSTGTPFIAAWQAASMPALTVNPWFDSTGDFYLFAGDVVVYRYAVTSSSVTIPAGAVYCQKV